MVLVNSQRGSDKAGSQDGRDGEDHLPVCRSVIGHDLELGVEVEEEILLGDARQFRLGCMI